MPLPEVRTGKQRRRAVRVGLVVVVERAGRRSGLPVLLVAAMDLLLLVLLLPLLLDLVLDLQRVSQQRSKRLSEVIRR